MGRVPKITVLAVVLLAMNVTAAYALSSNDSKSQCDGIDYNNKSGGEIPIILTDPAIADHNIGNVGYSVSNFGQYGLMTTEINILWDGEGFRMPQNGTNLLYEGALLIGDGPARVSNGARDDLQNFGDDFVAVTDISLFEPGSFADQEYHTSYNDGNAMSPLGILVEQKSYAFSSDPDDDYIITEYMITNTGNTNLQNVLVAHFEDWDMPWNVASDMVDFDRSRNLGYQYNGNNYRGQQVLSETGVYSFMALDNAMHVYPPMFTLSDKWSYMSAGIVDTAINVPIDCSMIITAGPYDIPAGESVVAVFAIMGGNGLADLQANADAAQARYDGMTSVSDGIGNMPESFVLSQNYPNPFNAQTKLTYNLSENSNLNLSVYNVMGQRVTTLSEGVQEAGEHSIIWNANDVPSGIYFARLETVEGAKSVKMVLLK